MKNGGLLGVKRYKAVYTIFDDPEALAIFQRKGDYSPPGHSSKRRRDQDWNSRPFFQ